jgi:hypothetical protein
VTVDPWPGFDPATYARASRERLLESPGWLPARFAGGCVKCGKRYGAGTPIHKSAVQGWVAECCQAVADE